MSIDNERLITEIQMKPCIWDTSCNDYKNRDKKNEEWNEVAVALDSNWKELSNPQKDEFCK